MLGEKAKNAAVYVTATVLTVATIALWGFAHRLYAYLLPGIASALALSAAQTDLARAAIAAGYFLMTLPAAFVSRNFGYKIGVLFGLGIFAVGLFLFYPAVNGRSFLLLVLAATVIGSGLAIVQVTAIPLIVFLGSRERAVQRMNFAQVLAPLGAIAALSFGQHIMAATQPGLAHSLIVPLASVGAAAIALAFLMEMVNFPPIAAERVAPDNHTFASFRPLLRIKHFRYGVMAQFLSLSSQAIMASFALSYCKAIMPSWTPSVLHQTLACAFLAIAAGRVIGPLLMYRIEPIRVLFSFGMASALLTIVSVFSGGLFAIICLVGACFFLSVVGPSLLAYTLRDLGEMAKSGAAITMFVAFSGTGLIALATLLSTPQTIHMVMLVPALGFGAAAFLARAMYRLEDKRGGSQPPQSLPQRR